MFVNIGQSRILYTYLWIRNICQNGKLAKPKSSSFSLNSLWPILTYFVNLPDTRLLKISYDLTRLPVSTLLQYLLMFHLQYNILKIGVLGNM